MYITVKGLQLMYVRTYITVRGPQLLYSMYITEPIVLYKLPACVCCTQIIKNQGQDCKKDHLLGAHGETLEFLQKALARPNKWPNFLFIYFDHLVVRERTVGVHTGVHWGPCTLDSIHSHWLVSIHTGYYSFTLVSIH